MLCPFPFPLFNSPSFLTSSLINEPQTQRRGLKMNDVETSKAGRVQEEEEDYIDIEINTSISGEIEFQMFSSSTFHVIRNLAFVQECKAPSIVASSSLSAVSPSESCRGSCEVWCKKMRLMKQSSVTQKLKSSRAYLRSLFMRSACSDENNCVKTVEKVKCSEEDDFKGRQAPPSFTMKSMLERDQMDDDQISFTCHRKSFSEAIKRHCKSKCYNSTSSSSNCSSSSSSFSLKSTNGFYEISLLKRNINTEVENSIEGAIAYCKKTHLKHDSSHTKMTASGRPGICRV